MIYEALRGEGWGLKKALRKVRWGRSLSGDGK
jgi:hypothetical protein